MKMMDDYTRLGCLHSYLQSLIQLNAQGVHVTNEMNAVMDAINRELGINPKWRNDKTEKVVQAAIDFVTACEKKNLIIGGAVRDVFLNLRQAVYNLGA